MAFSRSLGPAPHRRVLDLLRAIPVVDAQNRLLRLGDKTIATSLLYMSEWERDRVIALLGREKGTRVRDEVRRQERSRVAYDYYETAVRSMITALEGGTTGPPRTYYRPTRSRTR